MRKKQISSLKLYAVSVVCLIGNGCLPTLAGPTNASHANQQSPGLRVVQETLPVSGGDMAILQESKPLVTRAGAWHTWNDHFPLLSGQEKMRLVLTFNNGAEGRPKFTDLRVQLARKPFLTLKDFAGADTFSCNLSNQLQTGNTQLAVQGWGPSGARLNWKLYIQRPLIVSVEPSPVSPVKPITVAGRNFSSSVHDLKVLIANKPAKLLSAKDTEVQLQLPAHVPGGNQDLVVVLQSVKSQPFKISVRANPKITSIDMLASPPGQPVTISGSGFSGVASQNAVKFGSVRAHIVSATASSITCIVPEMHFPQWDVPITVITNGVSSKDKVHINLDMRVIPNEGVAMP